ncbi:hypothetical protein TNCV_3124601 [Trichonephila clavipes]|nr:hypothetical protein TNCV_3124601 [Trichonephila clavipes]
MILHCSQQRLIRKLFQEVQKKKSKGLMFEERGSQETIPLRPIYLPGYVQWRWLLTSIEKNTGAPLCINHTFLGTLAGTPCSYFGR